MYTYMNGLSPIYSPYAPALMLAVLPLLVLALVWTIVIKGYALWHAARNGQKGWFIALLVINTVGVLEIVYLLWFRPDTSTPSQSNTPMKSSSS